jgi:hypothetical protein
MSALSALRSCSRIGSARFVVGMRVSSVASAVTRPALLRTVTGARAFSATVGRFGSGSSAYYLRLRRVYELRLTHR